MECNKKRCRNFIKKRVKERFRSKKLSVRIDHIRPSKCRLDFLQRCKFNREYVANHKKDEKKFPKRGLKRQPALPEQSTLVKVSDTTIADLKIPVHVDIVDL